jgi:hypothetical protein
VAARARTTPERITRGQFFKTFSQHLIFT